MGRPRIYTDEERIAARRERVRKWQKENPEKVKESFRKWKERNPDYMKEWREKNSEKVKEWREKNSEKVKESQRKWYEANYDKVKEYVRKWREENKDDFNAYYKEWIKEKRKKDPILARAQNICDSYRTNDKKYNRGKCTLTAKWIVDNIFTQPCFYCDESDWHKLGCDRIYNSLTHTPENVVCCCEECNKKRGRKGFVEYLKEIGRLYKLKELKDKVIITDEVLID